MENQTLSPKEIYEQKRKEKELARGQNTGSSGAGKSTGAGGWVWLLVIVLIIGGLGSLLYFGGRSRLEDTLTLAKITADDWTQGPETAPLALIEYSDFQCPACAAYQSLVKKVLENYGEQIRFAYRHFPLPQHQNAEEAAYAAEAAGKQGKFWEMHDRLFENQTIWAELSQSEAKALFATYAGELGLDPNKFETDRASTETTTRVSTNANSGQTIGVNSTPTFFLNNKKISPRDYNEFELLIKDALAQ